MPVSDNIRIVWFDTGKRQRITEKSARLSVGM
eukprot:SAG31_NODE_31176_length_371_cov_0.757353_1_plen_31_part_10